MHLVANFDWNRAVPFVLLGIVGLVVLVRLVVGVRHGRLRGFRRRGSGRVYSRRTEPVGFWSLFAFYAICLLAIALMITAALRTPEREPPRNPGRGGVPMPPHAERTSTPG